MLGGELAVLQAPMFDGLSLDPFALFDDGWAPTEVGVGGRHVAQALVVTLVIIVRDEGLDLGLEVTGQEVVFQQDAVFEGLVPTLDLALGLRMARGAAHMAHLVGLDIFGQFAGDVTRAVVAEYTFSRGFPSQANTPRYGGVTVNLQAALYAQIAKGEGRIVSKPRISAQSGGTAKIVTGDALPILTSIALSGVNAVQQQVQYVNVGVTLQIAPRVSDDGMVTSHVFAVVSSVSGFSQGYPTISQREASTSATVRDGESFVVGGLAQESDLKHRSKIPILGDIPLVNALLSTENSTKSKTDLYIVVTPHVIRSGASSEGSLPRDYREKSDASQK